MPTPRPSVVLFVADVDRVARFYRELGAMREVQRDGDHVVLEVGAFELVVHRLRGEPEAPAADGSVRVRDDSYTKICIPVDSIAKARAQAPLLSGALKPPDWEWNWRDHRACDGHDPEGNVIQVRQALG